MLKHPRTRITIVLPGFQVKLYAGKPIDVGNGRHEHFATGTTTVADGHFHEFQFATLIQEPIGY